MRPWLVCLVSLDLDALAESEALENSLVPKTPYVVPYRVRDDRIEVLRVMHVARRWPRTL